MEKDFWNQDDFANNVVWGVGAGAIFLVDALYVAVPSIILGADWKWQF